MGVFFLLLASYRCIREEIKRNHKLKDDTEAYTMPRTACAEKLNFLTFYRRAIHTVRGNSRPVSKFCVYVSYNMFNTFFGYFPVDELCFDLTHVMNIVSKIV